MAAAGGVLICAATLSRPVRTAAWWVVGAFAACLLLGSGVDLLRAVRRRRRWPAAMAQLAGALSAGATLPEALAELGASGPAPLRPALRAFTGTFARTGCFGDALDGLQERMADPVADRVCEVLRTSWEVGGADPGVLIRCLAPLIGEDLHGAGAWRTRSPGGSLHRRGSSLRARTLP